MVGYFKKHKVVIMYCNSANSAWSRYNYHKSLFWQQNLDWSKNFTENQFGTMFLLYYILPPTITVILLYIMCASAVIGMR